MSTEATVLSSVDGYVCTLTLNRPHSLNALNAQLMDEFAAALETASRDDDVRALIVTGSGRAFCAGADIAEIDAISPAELLDPRGFPQRMFATLAGFAKPVIAAVNGAAYGGGCELVLACDTAVAADSARFALPEVSLGVIPGAGGTQRLMAAVGKAKAMRMMLAATVVDSKQALADGLVAEVVPDDQCLPAATALARQIAAHAPIAVRLAKDAALASLQPALTSGLAQERRNFFLALQTEDRREGTNAFLSKRRPTYIGQ